MKNSKLRASRGNYETARALLRLAVFLQGSPFGRTIKEIQAHLTCSRATANRWLEALRDTPELRPRSLRPRDGDNPTQYRWVLDKRQLPVTVGPEPEDIVALGAVAADIPSKSQRSLLLQLRSKLEAIANEQRREVVEVRADDRMAYRGFLVRAGFRYELDEKWVSQIEGAILRRHRILLTLGGKAPHSTARTKLVLPIGILTGLKTILVAADATIKGTVRAYDFDEIDRISETKDKFNPGRLPSIEEYADQMYGFSRVGVPEDVALEFSGTAAAAAQRYRFHPSQTVEDEFNGGICIKRTIRFQAIGLYELGLDILRFGTGVRVLSPSSLAAFHKGLVSRIALLSKTTNVVGI